MESNHFWVKIDLKTDEIIEMADTQGQLALKCGVKADSIRQTLSRAKRLGHRCCYLKIEDNDNE